MGKGKVDEEHYRRKMNFLLRKRINNRRWFLNPSRGARKNPSRWVKKKLNDEAVAVHAEEVRASKRAKITEMQTEEDSHSSESKATMSLLTLLNKIQFYRHLG